MKSTTPIPTEVKAAIWMLLILCGLQIAAPLIAIEYPVVGPMKDGIGYPHPWVPTWATYSCGSVPLALLNLGLAALALCSSDVRYRGGRLNSVWWLWGVIVADVMIILFACVLFFVSQLGFIHGAGS